jgi:hypothetical protein
MTGIHSQDLKCALKSVCMILIDAVLGETEPSVLRVSRRVSTSHRQ